MKELLLQLLYAVTEFKFQTQIAHWNIEGKDFSQLHAFFGDLYTASEANIDLVAEKIRIIDGVVEFDTKKLGDGLIKTSIENMTDPVALLRNTLTNNAIIISILNNCMREANDKNLFSLQNFFSALLEEYEKNQWMIRAHLK